MKTKNFPEKRNQRQKNALRRLMAKEEPNGREKKEIEILKSRVSPTKRHQKSKKYRGR